MQHLLSLLSVCLLLLLAACSKENLQPRPDATPATTEIGEAVPDFDPSVYGPGQPPAVLKDELEAEYLAELAELKFETKRHRVVVPPGSVNALADAIARAGKNGVVRLAAGDYTEDATLTITQPVSIFGEPGARILFKNNGFAPPTEAMTPGIHILGAAKVRVFDVELIPADGPGSTAILIQDAPRAFVSGVTAKNWQYGVMISSGYRTYVNRSTFVGIDEWRSDPTLPCFAIINNNGKGTRIHRNDISNTVQGVWACDERGRMFHNRLTNNYNGLILCAVPPGYLILPDGTAPGAEHPATRWGVGFNTATDNINSGYEIIDGAERNALWSNHAQDNGTQDYEFVGQTSRYGLETPTCLDNYALIRDGDTWKDCGEDNYIRGGTEIDTELDPCF